MLVCGLFGWLLGFGFIVAACFGIGWLIRLNNVLILGCGVIWWFWIGLAAGCFVVLWFDVVWDFCYVACDCGFVCGLLV